MSSSFDSRDPFDDGFVRDVDKGPVHADFVPHEEDHPHAFCLDDKGKEKYNEFPCNQDGLFAVSFGIVMGVLALLFVVVLTCRVGVLCAAGALDTGVCFCLLFVLLPFYLSLFAVPRG